MSFRQAFSILVIGLILILTWANVVQAGFGISPPLVKSDRLIPGSHYEQKILLLRSDPNEDLKAEITIDASEIEKWISIEPGKEFILPKGELQVPMFVKVDVPKDAEFKNYKGYIRVRTSSVEAGEKGGVAITLGARIDIDLIVVKEEIFDFLVRRISIPNLEEGLKFWRFHFPGKIKVLMLIENKGNVKIAPSKVTLNVYDLTRKNLLQSSEDKTLKKIEPFETKEILAEFPTKLGVGQYYAEIKIFKGEEISEEGQTIFTIFERGTLPSETKEFLGLSIWIWAIIGIVVLAGIGYGGYRGYKFCKKKKEVETNRNK
jgi:hypothetical protein